MKLEDFKVIDGDHIKDATPEMIAEMYANMYSDEQARFFNHIAEVASKFGGMAMQNQYITDEDGLTLAGRRVMQGIGEYSHWGLVPRAKAV
jgi:hypothetical protein